VWRVVLLVVEVATFPVSPLRVVVRVVETLSWTLEKFAIASILVSALLIVRLVLVVVSRLMMFLVIVLTVAMVL